MVSPCGMVTLIKDEHLSKQLFPMFCRLFGRSAFCRFTHSWNAQSPMAFNVLGNATSSKDVHFSKHWFPMLSSPSANVTFFSAVHSIKQAVCTSSNVSGKVISAREVHRRKAFSPTNFNRPGKLISVNFLQSENAYSSIFRMVLGS